MLPIGIPAPLVGHSSGASHNVLHDAYVAQDNCIDEYVALSKNTMEGAKG